MLVGNGLGWFIIISICLLVIAGLAWLLLRKPSAHPNRFYLAVLAGFICGFFLYNNTLCIIEVVNESDIRHYMVFGSTSYEATDGQKLDVTRGGMDDTFIINATDHMMAIESIEYGDPDPLLLFDFGPSLIEPHTTKAWFAVPDYFPNETPPGSVSVTKGIERETKHWLRFGY